MASYDNWIRAIGVSRIGFGVLCNAAPGPAAQSIVESPEEMNSAATSFAALTGTRAAALGTVELAALKLEPATRRNALLLAATVDTIDTVAGALRYRRAGRVAPLVINGSIGVAAVIVQVLAALED